VVLVFDLGWLLAIVLAAVGVYALAAPRALAHHYGLAVEGHAALGYVRATGARDVALAVLLGATAYVRSLPLLIVFAAVAILVSGVDFWVVTHHGGLRRPHVAHAIHASGIVAFVLVLTMALFAIGW
jgi:hypothetical protein